MKDFKNIDLNDSSLMSFSFDGSDLKIRVYIWNEIVVQISFLGMINFIFNESDFFKELVVVPKSPFLDRALSYRYAKTPSEPAMIFPQEHPYHHFRLLDINDNAAFEVIAEDILVEVVEQR